VISDQLLVLSSGFYISCNQSQLHSLKVLKHKVWFDRFASGILCILFRREVILGLINKRVTHVHLPCALSTKVYRLYVPVIHSFQFLRMTDCRVPSPTCLPDLFPYAFLSKVFPAISTKTTDAMRMTATSVKRGKSAPILPVSNGKIMFLSASIP